MTPSINQCAIIEGQLTVKPEARFAIVASRFNNFIVQHLIDGALDALARHGADLNRVLIVRVPGAWEMAPVVRRLAKSGKADAVIALGAVIRGSTPHFDYIASEAAKGLAHTALDYDHVPVVFGVLTTDTIEQAVERAGTKAGNKGFDAALSAIEMVSVGGELSAAGW